MKTIYKYPLIPPVEARLRMHEGATPLAVQMQNGEPFLWAVVDTDAPIGEPRRFRTYGTGDALAEGEERVYIGTIQEGQFVWHIFEVLAP